MCNSLIGQAGPSRLVYKVYQLWQARLFISDSYLLTKAPHASNKKKKKKTQECRVLSGEGREDNGGSFSTKDLIAFPSPTGFCKGSRGSPVLQMGLRGTNLLSAEEAHVYQQKTSGQRGQVQRAVRGAG